MSYIKDINICEAIIHVLNNNSNEPLLNTEKLELTEDKYVFLYKHLEKCFKNENLKYAKFIDNNSINDLAQNYFSGKTNLVDISKDIATNLFDLTKEKDNFSSYDLIVVSISTEAGPLLGILKMDYIKNYVHSVNQYNDNKISIDIVLHNSSLPNNKKLQKCAFIRPYNDKNEYDLMIIDIQTKREEKEYGCEYFMTKFLNCYYIKNNKDLTKQFLESSSKWTNIFLKENAVEQERVRSSIKDVLKSKNKIDLNEIAEDLFDDTVTKENFRSYVKDFIDTEEEIEIDKEWIENKFKKIKLKIDKDIEISLSENTFNDSDKFIMQKNNDGTVNIIIKNIKNYIEK